MIYWGSVVQCKKPGTHYHKFKASVDSPIKILNDKTRLNYLFEIPPPTTKAELNSFLGLINTFKIWSPTLNPHSPILRDLGRKDSVFSWNPEAQVEFEQLKHNLKSLLEINPY